MKRIYQLGLTCRMLACAHPERGVTRSMAIDIAASRLKMDYYSDEVRVFEAPDRYVVYFYGPRADITQVWVSKATGEVLRIGISQP